MANTGAWLRDSPGDVLALFREHAGGLTKADAMKLTGLSRTAISARVDALAQVGLLATKAGSITERRGRPAERFELDPLFGISLVADTGATGMRVAVFDAVGQILDERYEAFDITDGPAAILGRIEHQFDSLLIGREASRVLGIGVDLPGPVDFTTRRVISPPVMTGWHNYDIAGYFRSKFSCPIIVEKDTNAMAFGEQRRQYPATPDLMFVKLGTGIGAGLVIGSELYRGADGAAGDIGHMPYVTDGDALPCRCGERGCLEAYASGWALARDLTAAGYPCASVNDVIALVRSGNTTALALVRQASEIICTAVGDLVTVINPRLLVFGGQLADLDEIVLASARRVIYGRASALATRNLRIVSTGIEDPGVHGLAELVADEVFSSRSVDRLVSSWGESPRGGADRVLTL